MRKLYAWHDSISVKSQTKDPKNHVKHGISTKEHGFVGTYTIIRKSWIIMNQFICKYA